MNDIPVSICRDWSELSELLYADSWNNEIGRFRSSFAFRGLIQASYNLRTSLMRMGGDYDKLERSLLRNFRKYASRDAVAGDSVWNWLTLAQHHGLPTRLVDWTYSPLVAIHFATADVKLYDEDSVIWCVDYAKTHQFLPNKLRSMLEEEDSETFTAEMLSRVATTLRQFDHLADDPFVVFFEPPSLDERIVNQYALFSVMSSVTMSLDEWLADKPDLCHKIVIPASAKWEIRDKLDQANITERVLFPGLDGLSRWLKRYYGPKTHP